MLTPTVSPFTAPSFDVFAPARRQDPRGVIQGVALDGGQSYVPWIGLSTVRELALKHADQVGLVTQEQLELAVQWATDTEALLAQANERIDELERLQHNITGLVKAGFKVQRAVGRPPKKETN